MVTPPLLAYRSFCTLRGELGWPIERKGVDHFFTQGRTRKCCRMQLCPNNKSWKKAIQSYSL